MSFRTLRRIISISILVFIFVPGLPIRLDIPPHRAAAVSFTLYGRITPLASAGWGTSAATTKSPGPTLVVSPSDSVTMSLFSADGVGHTFCIDLEAVPNFICDPGEPLSPTFNSMTIPLMYTFNAPSAPGNYTYYCTIHGDPMVGTFTVSSPTHDVAVTSIKPSRSFAYSGVSSNPVQVNVTASNLGTSTENFFVAAIGNSTVIGNQTITLAAGQTSIVSFMWDTSSIVRGNYVLSAQATKVTGETNTGNNIFTGSIFNENLRGDVTGDCKVNIIDVSTVNGVFGQAAGGPRYNPVADQNNDGRINIIDVTIVNAAFGHVC